MARAARIPLMAGNWKMNLNHHEAVAWCRSWPGRSTTRSTTTARPRWSCCRRSPTCAACRRWSTATGSKIGYGAQDVSTHDDGAYTGEISAAMLAKLGCSYVVVGHSERREYHGEDDALVNAKAHKAVAAGMTPIVCVGEGLDVRKAGEQVAHTLAQLDGSLAGFDAEQVADLVVAYEPVWAIGTGEVATPEDAQEVCAAIRARIAETSRRRGRRRRPHPVRRLGEGGQRRRHHGRSPTSTAALVGGASLQAEEFGGICRFYAMPVL